MAYLLIAVGLVCLIAGIVLFTNAPKTDDTIPNNTMNKEEVKAETTAQPTAQSDTSNANEKDESYEKGVEFEEYVVSRFSKKYFSLKEWRSDKCSNGVYAESSTYPDMEYTFTLRENSYNFAVECKWRANIITRTKLSAHIKTNWHVTVNLRKRRTCPSSLFWALAALLQPRQKSSLCLWLPSNM